jgi:hypothetical protein
MNHGCTRRRLGVPGLAGSAQSLPRSSLHHHLRGLAISALALLVTKNVVDFSLKCEQVRSPASTSLTTRSNRVVKAYGLRHATRSVVFHEVSSVISWLTMTRIRLVSQRGQYQQSNSVRQRSGWLRLLQARQRGTVIASRAIAIVGAAMAVA